MIRKNIFIITLLITGIIISCFLLTYYWDTSKPKCEVNIQREFSDSSEEIAIQKAEELDLATILSVTRYNGWWSDARTNDPSTKATAYVWPYILDKEVLDFYQNKINKLKHINDLKWACLDYKAEGEKFSDISISYHDHNRTIGINGQIYIVDFTEPPLFYDPLDPSSNDSYSHCAIVLNNSLEVISNDTQSVQINISDGYLVTQDFDYTETYGPTAAFGGGAEQIIVLDQDYEPILILSRPTGGWIA